MVKAPCFLALCSVYVNRHHRSTKEEEVKEISMKQLNVHLKKVGTYIIHKINKADPWLKRKR